MKRTIIYLIIILAVAGGVFAYLQYNKPHRDTADEQPAYTFTASSLLAEYEQDEAVANKKYLDKLVQVKGRIADRTTAEDGTNSLLLDSGDPLSGVTVQLLPEEVEKLENYPEGEEVTLKGICTGKLMDVVLVRGVIVE